MWTEKLVSESHGKFCHSFLSIMQCLQFLSKKKTLCVDVVVVVVVNCSLLKSRPDLFLQRPI